MLASVFPKRKETDNVQDERAYLESLLQKLQEFERTYDQMNPETRCEFDAMMRLVQRRIAVRANPQSTE